MQPTRHSWYRSLVRAIAGVGMVCIATNGDLEAQGIGAQSFVSPTAAAAPGPATFQALSSAAQNQDFTAVQLRRFLDDKGNVATVRERLEVDANGTGTPEHAVTFLGVEGVLPGTRIHLKWQQTYARFAPLFYRHGTFRLKSLVATQANYSIHDFGPVVRAGRSARRTVVFPNSMEKAIWVIDVDAQTSVPLYSAEFDGQLRLLSEVEVISFADTVASFISGLDGMTMHASYQAAKTSMGSPTGLMDPNVSSANDYQLQTVEVRDDPLNGWQSLVMTFTDGIDQFLVTQTPNVPDLFAGFPAQSQGGQTIARYRDPALSVLLYWEGGVQFQVAGRGAMHRLDALTRTLYLQALSSN
jgi:hypothetical protein